MKDQSKDTGSCRETGTPSPPPPPIPPGQHSLWSAYFLCGFPMSSALHLEEVGRSISYRIHVSSGNRNKVMDSGYISLRDRTGIHLGVLLHS